MISRFILPIIIALLASTTTLANTCYKVNLLKALDSKKCSDVQVNVESFDCNDAKKDLVESDVTSQVDCSGKSPKLVTKYKGEVLISELEPATIWGGINYKVTKTTLSIGQSLAAETEKENEVVKPKPEALPLQSSESVQPKKKKKKIKIEPKLDLNDRLKDAVSQKTVAAPTLTTAEAIPAPTKAAEPAVTPMTFKVSGFAWIEYEKSKNFGYDGTTALPNFDSTQFGNEPNFSTFMTNIQMDITKDKTNFTSIFEVGEIMGGENSTGGAQGGRQKILEIRNMFLSHEINSRWALRAGLISLSTDPNSYILSDHHSALIVDYKTDPWTGSLWTAKAKEIKVGTTPATTSGGSVTSPIYPDTYIGLSVTPKINDSTKLTAFAVNRKTRESLNDQTATAVVGASEYNWLGATYDKSFNEIYALQLTGIMNQGKFTGDVAGSATDTYSAYLADLKLVRSWKESGWDLGFEFLTTSGSTGGNVIGLRKGFASPDPGAAYLLTVATSDGADDAPGTPKESIIGNLSQAEGLQIGVLKLTKTFSDKLSSFVRIGSLQSSTKQATTQSQDMGQEVDLNLTYELAPGTQVQADYGYFKPGSFFTKKDAAELFTTRLKFSF